MLPLAARALLLLALTAVLAPGQTTEPPASDGGASGGPPATSPSTDAQKPDAQPPADSREPDTPATPDAAQIGELTAERLRSRLDAVEAREDLPDEKKKELTDLYQKALSALQRADTLKEETAQLDRLAETAPEKTEELRQQAAAPVPDQQQIEREVAGLSPEQVEARLKEQESEVESARARLKELESTLAELRNRPEKLRQLIEQTEKQLAELDQQLAALSAGEDETEMARARGAWLRARKRMLQAELALHQKEQSVHSARQSLIAAQREAAARRIARLEPRLEALRQRTLAMRQRAAAEARQQAEQLKQQAKHLPPKLREWTEKHVERSRELEQLAERERWVTEQLAEAKDRLEQVGRSFETLRRRIEAVGLTESVGRLLRQQRQALPDVRAYRRSQAEIQERISETAGADVRVDEVLRKLTGADQRVREVIDGLPESADEQMRQRLRERAAALLDDHRQLLRQLDEAYGRHLSQLEELDEVRRQLIERTREFERFINEHRFWTRSMAPVGVDDARRLVESVAWLIDPAHWKRAGLELWQKARSGAVLWLLGLIAALGLIAFRRAAGRSVVATRDAVQRASSDTFLLTLRALLMTALIAAGGPALLALVGWALSGSLPPFAAALGGGLVTAAGGLGLIEFVRQLCRPRGLADGHFQWPRAVRASLRSNLLWLACVLLPVAGLVTMTDIAGPDENRSSLGRLAFVIGCAAMVVATWRVLRPSGEVMQWIRRRFGAHLFARMRYVWLAIGIAAPLVLIGLALAGYFYSATQLARRAHGTLWVLLAVALTYELALRWLFVAQRHRAMAEARQRREQARREAEPDGQAETTEAESLIQEEPQLDRARIDEQTTNLLRMLLGVALLVGLWIIWAPVLPALNIFQQVTLWTYSAPADGGGTQQLPITLGSVALAIVILVLSIVAARNLPGVLELAVLSRVNMDHGARYAVSTVCRYLLTIIGIVAAFNTIGIGWSQVQFLVAALGVGLGFGLQEIVANFVCGLILLFERPLRVGDLVTIADTTGYVTRLRIRATTITDFDRKELIVPNKEFITGRMINWSLTDRILRVTFNINVAHGTDPDRAEKLLYRAARQCPHVLDDPEPVVVFWQYGEHALNFELRVYIDGIDDLIPTRHQIQRTIDKLFREHGLAIAFPQRDVHLDTGGQPIAVQIPENPRSSGGA